MKLSFLTQDVAFSSVVAGFNNKVLIFQDINRSNLKSFIFVIARLSLLEYPGLKAIDPAYALPVDVVNRIFFGR